MSDYPMLISNKLHSFRNFLLQRYKMFMRNMFYNIEICVFFFIFLKNTLFCHLRITNILHNSAIRIYLFELKRVRRITLFLGNELATVPIAVVCIALLVRITLTDAKIQN